MEKENTATEKSKWKQDDGERSIESPVIMEPKKAFSSQCTKTKFGSFWFFSLKLVSKAVRLELLGGLWIPEGQGKEQISKSPEVPQSSKRGKVEEKPSSSVY